MKQKEPCSADPQMDELVTETAEALAMPKFPERYVRTREEIRIDKELRRLYRIDEDGEPIGAEP